MKKYTTYFFSIFACTVLIFMFAENALAGSATLTWNANTEQDLASYKIYYGTTPRTGSCPQGGYTNSLNVGKVTSHTFDALTNGQTYYFSVTAIDTSNNESCFSSQVSKVIPASDTGTSQNIWGTRTTTSFNYDNRAWDLGMIFTPNVAGSAVGARVYSAPSESGVHTVRLWRNSDNTLLSGPHTFTYAGQGWKEFTFPNAVPLSANTAYTVTVSTGGDTAKWYTAIPNDLTVTGTNGANLTYPANAAVYSETIGTRPSASYQSENYLRDITFVPGSTTVPPTVCTSFTYSAWSTCTNNLQSRTVTSSLPTGCTGGTPVLTQACTPPATSYTLTTTKSGTGSGAITSGDTSISCGTDCTETLPSGTTVTLTATPVTGSYFAGWSGACTGTASTCTVTLTSAKTVTATFTLLTVTDTTPPVITNVALKQSGSQGLVLTWTTSEPATTRLDYGTTISLGNSTVEDTSFTTTHSVTLSKLVRGKTYYVQARSRDTMGNVGTSPIKSITIATKPGKVTNLKAVAGSVVLSWSLPAVQNFTSITIQRNGKPIASLPATATTYTDEAVNPNTSYTYKVITVDDDGVVSYPTQVNFRTPRDIPRNETRTTTPVVETQTPTLTTKAGNGIILTPSSNTVTTPKVDIPFTTVSTVPIATTATPRYMFTASLKYGVVHADVKALQQFLNTKGYTVATTGPGSRGNETTYFGPATRAAVTKFQQANNIGDATSYGLVGPKTRAKLQELQG